MLTFILRRAALIVPTFIGVTLLAFALIHLIPGDPARTILGIHATPRRLRAAATSGWRASIASSFWSASR